MTTKLPSGMLGDVRGLSGRDGRYLTNDQVIRDNQVEDFIFQHCWKTIDPAVYVLGAGGEPDWNNVLVGDRFYTLIAVREATYPGEPYPIKLPCPACKKTIEWEVDLRELLEKKTKHLSEVDAELFKAGNRFPEILPGSKPPRKFEFKLKTGGDAKRTAKKIENKKTGPKWMQEKQNRMIDSLEGSILGIEGVETKGKRDAVFDFLEELPLGVIDKMLPLMQGHDCGVDTTIGVECQHCGRKMEVELPFDRAFFLPSTSAAKFMPDPTGEEKATENEPGPDPLAL